MGKQKTSTNYFEWAVYCAGGVVILLALTAGVFLVAPEAWSEVLQVVESRSLKENLIQGTIYGLLPLLTGGFLLGSCTHSLIGE